MQKPKLSIGQTCYFAMFGNNPETGAQKFTVHSGKVKGLEYDSETGSIEYILDVPFDISQTPRWLRRFFPSRFAIFKPLHRLYHHFHKDHIYVASEDEVFYDFRDAVANYNDFITLMEENGSWETHGN